MALLGALCLGCWTGAAGAAAGEAAGRRDAAPVPACVSIRAHPEGTELLRLALSPEEPVFAVAFRHSVERTAVLERYRVVPGDGPGGRPQFVLFESEFRSLGAGLPVDGKLAFGPDGPVLVVETWRRLDTLILHVLPLTEHAVVLPDGRRVALLGLARREAGPGGESDGAPAAGAALELVPVCGAGTGEDAHG